MQLIPQPKYYNQWSEDHLSIKINPYYCVLHRAKFKAPNLIKYSPDEVIKASICDNVRKDNLAKSRKTNNLSYQSTLKVKKALAWMEATSTKKVIPKLGNKGTWSFRLAFLTLTLPSQQVHTDKEIKKECLDLFLQALRDKYNVTKYVWRAELQQNNNIHYHIVIDRFIHHKDIRKLWNKYVNRLEYVDKYYEISGNYAPPSTEIKAAKSSQSMRAYISKYITKSVKVKGKKKEVTEPRLIEGRQYGISHELAKQKPIQINSLCPMFVEIGKAIAAASFKVVKGKYHKVFIYSEMVFRQIINYLDNSVSDLDEVLNELSLTDYFNLLNPSPPIVNIRPNLA